MPPWKWFLGFSGSVMAGYCLFPWPRAQAVLTTLLGLSCAVVTVAGVRGRTTPMWPWYLLALARIMFTLGDVAYWWQSFTLGHDVFPSVSDVFYLGFYVPLVAALYGLVRARQPGQDRAGLLDALILSTGAAMLAWVYLIVPNLHNGDMSVFARGVSVAYPVADLVVIGVLIRLGMGRGERSPAFLLMVTGMAITMAGDIVYALQQVTGTYSAGDYLDLSWLGGCALMGAAALHPSVTSVGRPGRGGNDGTIGLARIVALSTAGLMAPGVLAVQWLRGVPLDVPIVVAGSITLFLLVIARLHGVVTVLTVTLRHAEQQANHDQLTGLANRRQFHDRWQRQLGHAGTPTALLYVDLDDFKPVNDRYGHQAGDEVLIQAGARLRSVVRAGDVVARLGGDEFAVILPDTTDAVAAVVARRLVEEIRRPFPVAGAEIIIGASVGVVTAPPGADAEDMLRQADEAMYARKTGRPAR
ncbi:diguanylate cyclase domain-containing protein [Actinoplanes sp. NPDC051494]|uniref:diguanylate cyclase domain-containing protein n=1 Tax=Actinoplanes sp. NPDC051494 TaxID=3363907 RepID=UPI00379FA029